MLIFLLLLYWYSVYTGKNSLPHVEKDCKKKWHKMLSISWIADIHCWQAKKLSELFYGRIIIITISVYWNDVQLAYVGCKKTQAIFLHSSNEYHCNNKRTFSADLCNFFYISANPFRFVHHFVFFWFIFWRRV